MKFKVVGAGMAGLLAAAILRDDCSEVLEMQSELPNNHSALLRFRSSIVGDALNIPFRKVKVMKAVVPHTGNPIGDALSYSLKTNGHATLRSSISANGEIEDRYIAPNDLINQMALKVSAPIRFQKELEAPVTSRKRTSSIKERQKEPIISTIPMPVLMTILEYPDKPEFKSVIGYNLNVKLQSTDVCATLYYPNPSLKRYRASITGDRLTIEYAFPGLNADESAAKMDRMMTHPKECFDECQEVLADFGLGYYQAAKMIGKPEIKLQRYAKVLPIEDTARKRFIVWASDEHGIFSLGRFATWRPSLLLDDIVNDVRVIQKIAADGAYDHRK